MNLLFLYTELAPYFICCLEKFIQKNDAKVLLVHWQVNSEAPFDFSFPDGIILLKRNDFSTNQLLAVAEEFSPDAILCSGWLDKGYLRVCRRFKKKIPVITALDNHWKGKLSQHIAALISPFTIQKCFSHCWVPGTIQKQYALRLGFSEEKIFTGFYSADYHFFHKLFLSFREEKRKAFPKRFLYVARYNSCKGITDLWNAFLKVHEETPNDWELWCAGTGNIQPFENEHIRHFGFVQPLAMQDIISQTGVYVLPSRFEPWGVSVHEFAAAGFPLILSSEVGARQKFLKENVNGFSFEAGNISALKDCLKKIMLLKDEQLFFMAEKSATLAEQITPDKWADRLAGILNSDREK